MIEQRFDIWVCWSIDQRIKMHGTKIHVQGDDDKALCGIPYGDHWDFDIHEKHTATHITCQRCRKKFLKKQPITSR